VSAAQRIPAMPDVPTFAESKALAGVEMRIWAFVFAPQGTPAPAVARLNEVIDASVASPAMRAAVARLAAETPTPLTPAQSRAFIDEQVRLYEPVTRDIRPE
jgi:tripartite-type tricarboxylate transporter receptor subunit TctC